LCKDFTYKRLNNNLNSNALMFKTARIPVVLNIYDLVISPFFGIPHQNNIYNGFKGENLFRI